MIKAERQTFDEVREAAGIESNDAQVLASLGIHGCRLLLRRLSILRVDPNRLSSEEPAEFRELQKNCSACQDRLRCVHDLQRDVSDPTRTDWQEYCPNAAAIKLLAVLALIRSDR